MDKIIDARAAHYMNGQNRKKTELFPDIFSKFALCVCSVDLK